MTQTRPKWLVSYAGEVDIQWKGKEYAVRRCSFPGPWSDYWGSVVPWVGTVRCRFNCDNFPPAELMAFFPGYVAARYNVTMREVEYQGGTRPEVIREGDEFRAVAPFPNMA